MFVLYRRINNEVKIYEDSILVFDLSPLILFELYEDMNKYISSQKIMYLPKTFSESNRRINDTLDVFCDKHVSSFRCLQKLECFNI
jgi:hypothetical protein